MFPGFTVECGHEGEQVGVAYESVAAHQSHGAHHSEAEREEQGEDDEGACDVDEGAIPELVILKYNTKHRIRKINF